MWPNTMLVKLTRKYVGLLSWQKSSFMQTHDSMSINLFDPLVKPCSNPQDVSILCSYIYL